MVHVVWQKGSTVEYEWVPASVIDLAAVDTWLVGKLTDVWCVKICWLFLNNRPQIFYRWPFGPVTRRLLPPPEFREVRPTPLPRLAGSMCWGASWTIAPDMSGRSWGGVFFSRHVITNVARSQPQWGPEGRSKRFHWFRALAGEMEIVEFNPISGRLLATPISGKGGGGLFRTPPPLRSPVLTGRFLKFKRHSFRLNMIYISKKKKFHKFVDGGY